MLHVDLHVLHAVEFVHAEAVGGADAVRLAVTRGGFALERVEAHGFVPPAFLFQQQLQVPLADHPARSTSNVSQKSGCGKPWPQICASSMRAISRVKCGASRLPSVSMVRSRAAAGSISSSVLSNTAAKRS